jgi:antitoxin Xre/MbcA/ParS-like protein
MVANTLERASLTRANEARVLSEAVAKIASDWRLTNAELGRIIGISTTSAQRLKKGELKLERGKKDFELGQYLLRLFRSLDSIMGSDDAASISWLKSHNRDLESPPLELLFTISGLVRVTDYVDGYRAKV